MALIRNASSTENPLSTAIAPNRIANGADATTTGMDNRTPSQKSPPVLLSEIASAVIKPLLVHVAQKCVAVLGQRHASLKARRLDSFSPTLFRRPHVGSVAPLVTPIRLTQRSAELIAGLQGVESRRLS
ncbi:hypothetical protein MPL3365_30675 [Mesorhizobium plurifarium]|uniref:Uncharacterized protein n=1 Tax=Mesorhizobium plurifarium TaxID=69974 RepID=A0A090G8K1_MESPL|nr:hypothetical protein MPL3365_30675 [Mesorhizobium plurifarium]